MGKILNKERIRNLNFFRKKMQKAIKEMIKLEKNETLKAAYERALINLETVPINFYPKKTLMSTVFRIGKHIISSEILGEHKQNFQVIRKGKEFIVIPEGRVIDLPAEHFFHGNELEWKGVHTLMHEICHDPLRNVFEFSQQIHLNANQTEELIADLMSAKIAIKMGFSREKVLALYHGRESVYGRFPFREMLEKATETKIARAWRRIKETPKKASKAMKRKREKKGKPTVLYRPRYV
jgi:hypothetical protein